jgi:hypothetical protein
MATAHGFRVCEDSYAGVFWDDPLVTTTVGGGVVSENFHVAAHWRICCSWAYWRKNIHDGTGARVVIIEYDTADIVSTTGADKTDITMWDGLTRVDVTDDKTRYLISAGDPVDEFTRGEMGFLMVRSGQAGHDVVTILSGHGL